MRSLPYLTGAALVLGACNTVTFQDTLVRAKLEGPLPRPPVHLPRRDSSSFGIQGSLALSVSSADPADVQLLEPDQSDNVGNEGHGRETTWDHGVLSGSGEVSLLMGRHVRVFAGMQGDLDKKASWLGGGILLGNRRPLGIDLAVGRTTIARELSGYRVTTLTDNCYDVDRPCVPTSESHVAPDTTVWDRTEAGFTRFSLTWTPRGGGPWAEFAFTKFSDLARTIEGGWKYDGESFQFGAGYAYATPAGFLVAGARAESLGEGISPSLVFQFTGDVPLD